MLYRLLRPLVRTGLRFFYRKLYIADMDRMAKGRAVILATNHPSAFLEPSILACFLTRPLYFLVRGNFFKKPLYRMLLLDLNMLPIFRRKDGDFRDLKRNFSLLDQMYRLLDSNQVLMILAEGNMKQEKRLRPLQKGAARLAFGAYDKYGKRDIQILPVGINFDYADQYRQVGMLRFGEPMELEDYLDLYAEHPNRAIRQFTADLRERLAQHIIIIEKPEDDALVEHLFVMHRNDHPARIWPTVEYSAAALIAEKNIADCVNKMEASAKSELRKTVENYQQLLSEHKITDVGVARPALAKNSRTIAVVAGVLPFCLGFMLNYPPYLLTETIIQRYVKVREFIGPIRMAVITMAYFLYYVFGAILLSISLGWQGILLVMALMALAYFALHYQEFFRNWRSAYRFRQLPGRVQAVLSAKRREIIRFIPPEC